MAAANNLTEPLALIVGAYLCVSAVEFLPRDAAKHFLDDLRMHPGAMHAVRAVAFLAGATILALHRQWSDPAAIAVNLAAALWTFEGAGLLAQPGLMVRLFARPDSARRLRGSQAIGGLLGLFLLIHEALAFFH